MSSALAATSLAFRCKHPMPAQCVTAQSPWCEMLEIAEHADHFPLQADPSDSIGKKRDAGGCTPLSILEETRTSTEHDVCVCPGARDK
jgi:hypothetical protein